MNRRWFPIVCTLFLLLLSESAFAQSGRNRVKKTPPPPPAALEPRIETEPQAEKSDEDKIYSSKEVDVQAKFTKRVTKFPSGHQKGCPTNGTVRVRAVLHKSGKVTEATIIKGLGCNYDKDAVELVLKLKFVPAMKNGQPVSQYVTIVFDYKKLF